MRAGGDCWWAGESFHRLLPCGCYNCSHANQLCGPGGPCRSAPSALCSCTASLPFSRHCRPINLIRVSDGEISPNPPAHNLSLQHAPRARGGHVARHRSCDALCRRCTCWGGHCLWNSQNCSSSTAFTTGSAGCRVRRNHEGRLFSRFAGMLTGVDVRRLLRYGHPGPVFDMGNRLAYTSSYDRRMRNPSWVPTHPFYRD